jgi:hypothetical protein
MQSEGVILSVRRSADRRDFVDIPHLAAVAEVYSSRFCSKCLHGNSPGYFHSIVPSVSSDIIYHPVIPATSLIMRLEFFPAAYGRRDQWESSVGTFYRADGRTLS